MDNNIQPSQIYTTTSVNDQGNENFITNDQAKHNQDQGKKIAITKLQLKIYLTSLNMNHVDMFHNPTMIEESQKEFHVVNINDSLDVL